MKHDRHTETHVGVMFEARCFATYSTHPVGFLSRCPHTSTTRSGRPPRMQARGLSGRSPVRVLWQSCNVSMGMAHVLDFVFPKLGLFTNRCSLSSGMQGLCAIQAQSKAGTISGMNVLRIINEPTAAAIATLSHSCPVVVQVALRSPGSPDRPKSSTTRVKVLAGCIQIVAQISGILEFSPKDKSQAYGLDKQLGFKYNSKLYQPCICLQYAAQQPCIFAFQACICLSFDWC